MVDDNNQNNLNDQNGLNNQSNLNVEYLNDTTGGATVGEMKIISPKKTMKSVALKLVGVIIIILIGLFSHYMFTRRSPKALFINASNILFESFEMLDFEGFDKSVKYSGNLSIKTNVEDVKEVINDFKLDYTYGFDVKNKLAEFETKVKEGNNDNLIVNANIKNDNIYLSLKDIYEKIILIDSNTIKENLGISINEIFETIENSNTQIEDIKYIAEELKEITSNTLTKLNYSKTREKIAINNKDISVTKNTLYLNEENLKLFFNSIVDEFLKNDKLLDKWATLVNVDKNDLKKELEEFKKTIEEAEASEFEDNSGISIYTTGLLGNVVKVSLESENEEVLYYINYKDYKAFYSENTIIEINNRNLSLIMNDKVVLEGTVNTLEDNKIDVVFNTTKDSEDLIFKGSFKYNKSDKENNFDLNVEISEGVEKRILSVVYTTKEESENVINDSFVFKMNQDSNNIEIINKGKLSYGEKIATLNVNDNINYNNLTDSDFNNIMVNFEKKLENTPFGILMASNLKSNKTVFAKEVSTIIEASSLAYAKYLTDSSTDNLTVENQNRICFTVDNLINSGLLSSEYYDFVGTVTIINKNTYYVQVASEDYFIQKYSFDSVVNESDINDFEYMPNTFKTSCQYFTY